MALSDQKSKSRVCVIGLDGVPCGLIQELAQKGIMPTMGRLIASGHLHKMKASLPEISSVSWTNFMTGTNPGMHGIFGFTDLKEGTHQLRFPNFLDLKKETFWDLIGERDKKCIIINQPSTYPARKINGVLISGFVAIDPLKSIYPLSHKASLDKMGYLIDIDTYKARQDHDLLWRELRESLIGRQRAFQYFWQQDWDYFEFVITGTDRLQHFLWNAYGDESHQYHQRFLDYYRKVDQLIGEIVTAYEALTDGQDSLYLLSDHGFTAIEQEVYLNAWLEKERFLKFSTPTPESPADISQESKAFVLDPNRIYLNLKGKFSNGSVDESERKSLKEEIGNGIKELKYNGKRVVREIFDTEEVYSGPHLKKGPDLIVLSEYGFDMKGSVMKKDIFSRTDLQGMHTWDDAFFWAKKDCGQDLSISDLAKIIMENFS